MLESLKTPWWRLPLTLAVVGFVLIAVDLVVRLGWIPFLLGLALLVYAAYRFARGEVTGGPRLLLAACAGGVVLIAGLVWLHPQSWLQTGWELPGSHAQLVGRSGNVALFVDGDLYTARNTDGGDVLWSHRWHGRKVAVVGENVLVQRRDDPTKAIAWVAATNKHAHKEFAWRTPKEVTDDSPTAAQAALLPELGKDEHVLHQANSGSDYARLVAAEDPTGHKYTRLDIVVGDTLTQYRVRNATGLRYVDQVVVVKGHPTRVIPMIRSGS